MLDGADPLDMTGLLATMLTLGFAVHFTAFSFIWASEHLWRPSRQQSYVLFLLITRFKSPLLCPDH